MKHTETNEENCLIHNIVFYSQRISLRDDSGFVKVGRLVSRSVGWSVGR